MTSFTHSHPGGRSYGSTCTSSVTNIHTVEQRREQFGIKCLTLNNVTSNEYTHVGLQTKINKLKLSSFPCSNSHLISLGRNKAWVRQITPVHPGGGFSSGALLEGSYLFPPERFFFYFVGSFSWSDLRSKVRDVVICGFGLYKINWIENVTICQFLGARRIRTFILQYPLESVLRIRRITNIGAGLDDVASLKSSRWSFPGIEKHPMSHTAGPKCLMS